jgi:hypothetical protein
MESICAEADLICCSENKDIQNYFCAMTVLACLSVKLLNPIFSRTDAIGTVMRKKIKPVTDPIFEQLAILQQ